MPFVYVVCFRSIDGLGLAVGWFIAAATFVAIMSPNSAIALSCVGVYTLCGLIYEFCHYIG